MPNVFEVANGSRRKITKKDAKAINRVAVDVLLQEIQEAESRAHRLGMHVTAHALNRAKNALGWEIAGDIVQAGKASRDDRTGAGEEGE